MVSLVENTINTSLLAAAAAICFAGCKLQFAEM